MVLIVCLLKDYRLVEDVLLGFLEIGVTGATVFDARGMGQIIGSEVPIFADLRGLFPGSTADTHVILSAVTPTVAPAAMALVERVAGPFDVPGSGMLFTVPIGEIHGLKPPIA